MKNSILYVLLIVALVAVLLLMSGVFDRRDGTDASADMEEDPYGAWEYANAGDFYSVYADEFEDYEEAENYYFDHVNPEDAE